MTYKPQSGSKATGQASGYAQKTNRTDSNKVEKHVDVNTPVEFDFDPGDQLGEVGVTRGFKTWFSSRDAGMTVESTVTVSVHCNQDTQSIYEAAIAAGKKAEELANNGIEEMGLYITAFKQDIHQ